MAALVLIECSFNKLHDQRALAKQALEARQAVENSPVSAIPLTLSSFHANLLTLGGVSKPAG
jgi:hypothetical protein